MVRYNDDPDERLAILVAVHREARRVDIPPEMVLSVMHVESRFQRFAISRVGAQGLMQIMPFWKNEIGHGDANLFDVDTNIRFGCTILKHYLDRERGNWERALARYNGSLGKTWYPDKVMSAWDRIWFPG
ncbi:MAG: lytic transglycosylase domain-containing protein, partial [Litorivicinus sp.]